MHRVSECIVPKHVKSRRVHTNLYTKHTTQHPLSFRIESKMSDEVPADIIELAHSPTNLNSPKEVRFAQAKAWMRVYPTETASSIAKTYGFHPVTFRSALSRDKPSNTHQVGGLNRILSPTQEKAIHSFIRSLLQFSIQPTHGVVYNAICGLKAKEKKPSLGWFKKWYHKAGLHTITTKPIAVVRVTAAQINEVERWFQQYRVNLAKYQIKTKNIYNFDEVGFRVGCARGQQILVPLDIREVISANIKIHIKINANSRLQHYSISPENRRSLTIIETINATGSKPIPPMIIVQGKHIMLDWWTQNIDPDLVCYASENGFTSNLLCIEFLKHFIKHTKSGPDSEWKFLLMDNHGSHETGEAIQLAYENKILLYPLIAHLTHCMQPLDVGCFQPYKHWHDKAIHESLAQFDVEYGIRSFIRDLPEIRTKTFKKDT